MLLENKTAVIYGAGGMIGGSVARDFARNGARVFLAGRTLEPLKKVADDITAAGGRADVAVVDALDEKAVDDHADEMAAETGGIDVSFNLIYRGDRHGTPLAELATEDFLRPLTTGLASTFITARAAARHMIGQRRGVILSMNSGSARGGQVLLGGSGPTDAATDTLIRNLAAELGPEGIRVFGVWAAGIPETIQAEKLAKVNPNLDLFADATATRDLKARLDRMRMARRSPTLDEITDLISFLVSDRGAPFTGTCVNATGGMFAK
ncbi:SDR family NAD(P)-dependent oxidoreductase [Actinomadura sp. 9N215]|uniref:SDR family NAD(P)-dependent oxidoreductase n=1 Tax=Actinomadura sp. 9N215 TaxID=3375150 RepID=UPI00378B04BA